MHDCMMERQGANRSGGWACDAKYSLPGDKGCLRKCSGYGQMKNEASWRCGNCDFDLCITCCIYQNSVKDPKNLPDEVQDQYKMLWLSNGGDVRFFPFDTKEKVMHYMNKKNSDAKICLTPNNKLLFFRGDEEYVEKLQSFAKLHKWLDPPTGFDYTLIYGKDVFESNQHILGGLDEADYCL